MTTKSKKKVERTYCSGADKVVPKDATKKRHYSYYSPNSYKYQCTDCDKFIGKSAHGTYNKHGWNDTALTEEEMAAKVVKQQEAAEKKRIADAEAKRKRILKSGKYTKCVECREPILFDVDYLCVECRGKS